MRVRRRRVPRVVTHLFELVLVFAFAGMVVFVATHGSVVRLSSSGRHPAQHHNLPRQNKAPKSGKSSHKATKITALTPPQGHAGALLFSTKFSGKGYVISTEKGTPKSPIWDVTSGSLLERADLGWSGVPDAGPASGNYKGLNGSAVFRAIIPRRFGDLSVSLDIKPSRLVQTVRTPAKGWDGITVFIRYHSQYYLYAVNIARRDGYIAIKRKLPEGPTNGGIYTTLAQVYHPTHWGQWIQATIVVHNTSNNAVEIAFYLGGKLIAKAEDTGHPLRASGDFGLRADNCEFYLKDVQIHSWVA